MSAPILYGTSRSILGWASAISNFLQGGKTIAKYAVKYGGKKKTPSLVVDDKTAGENFKDTYIPAHNRKKP